MILREMKYYPITERNLVLNLVPGSCPKVLIAGRIPTKQKLQEQPEDPMKPNTRTESKCISFTEPHRFTFLILLHNYLYLFTYCHCMNHSLCWISDASQSSLSIPWVKNSPFELKGVIYLWVYMLHLKSSSIIVNKSHLMAEELALAVQITILRSSYISPKCSFFFF